MSTAQVNTNNDQDPTPKSFFFHSPPDSPVQPVSGNNPFSNLKDTVVAKLTTISRPGSSDGSRKPNKPKSSRPKTSDGTVLRGCEGHVRSGSSTSRLDWPTDEGPSGSNRNRSVENFQTAFPAGVIIRGQERSSHRSSFLFDAENLFRRGKSKRVAHPDPLVLPAPDKTEDSPKEEEVFDISCPEQTLQPQISAEGKEQLRDSAGRGIGLSTTRSFPPDSQVPLVSPIQEEGSEVEESNLAFVGLPKRRPSFPEAPQASSGEPVLSTLPTPPQIPAFPTAYPTLSHYVIRAASFPRYEEQGLALSHFMAKSRAWKSRLICVSSYISVTNSSSTSGFLHVFKYSTPSDDNIEIDRMEINKDSSAFIYDEEIGGRRHALLITGPDASQGTKRNRGSLTQYRGVDPSHQLCILYIEDGKEKQNWIGTVKNFVFSQRVEGAGLIPQDPTSDNGPGDLDLALQIRVDNLQLNASLPPISPVSPMTFSTLGSSTQQDVPSRTQSEISLEPSKRLSAVSTLRGFFSSTSLAREGDEGFPKQSSNLLRRRSRPPTTYETRGTSQPTSIKSIFRTSILAGSGNNRSHPFDPTGQIGSVYSNNQKSAVVPPRVSVFGPQDSSDIPESSGTTALTPTPLKLSLDSSESYIFLDPQDTLPGIVKEEYSPQTPEEHRAEALLALSTPRIRKSHASSVPPAPFKPPPQSVRLSIKGNSLNYGSLMLEKPLPPIVTIPSPQSEGRRSSSDTGDGSQTRYSQRFSNESGATSFKSSSDHWRQSRTSGHSLINRTSMPPPRRPPPNFAPPPVPTEQVINSSEKSNVRRTRMSECIIATPRGNLPPSKAPPTGPLPPTPATTTVLSSDSLTHERPRLHSAPSPSETLKQQKQRSFIPSIVRHPFSQTSIAISAEDEIRGRVFVKQPPQNREKFLRRPLPPLPSTPPINGHDR